MLEGMCLVGVRGDSGRNCSFPPISIFRRLGCEVRVGEGLGKHCGGLELGEEGDVRLGHGALVKGLRCHSIQARTDLYDWP